MDILAGMLLNWTVPLLIVVLVGALFPPRVPASFWPPLMMTTAAGAALALVAYGGLLRGSQRLRIAGGWTLGISTALAVAVGAAWLIDAGYDCYAAFHDKPGTLAPGLLQELMAVGGSGAFAGVLHFVIDALPLLRNSKVRLLAKKILLQVAGALIPLLAIWLFYVCRMVGSVAGDPTASIAIGWPPPSSIPKSASGLRSHCRPSTRVASLPTI